MAGQGARLGIVTRDRFFASDVCGLNHQAYARCFDRHGVRLTISKRVVAAERAGNRLEVTLGSDYSDRMEAREVDQLVVAHGTLPLDRSEERRVGKECVRPCRSRGSPYHYKKKLTRHTNIESNNREARHI